MQPVISLLCNYQCCFSLSTSRAIAMASSSPNSSVSSASSLMALQLFSRFFTFTLNQALFRLASPSAFGAAAIQFELIISTILFLSREGVRNALLRVSKHADADTSIKRTNISFLPIIFGVPLALSTCLVYAHFASQEMQKQPYFNTSIAIYAVAALWELLSEPFYNRFVKSTYIIYLIHLIILKSNG